MASSVDGNGAPGDDVPTSPPDASYCGSYCGSADVLYGALCDSLDGDNVTIPPGLTPAWSRCGNSGRRSARSATRKSSSSSSFGASSPRSSSPSRAPAAHFSPVLGGGAAAGGGDRRTKFSFYEASPLGDLDPGDYGACGGGKDQCPDAGNGRVKFVPVIDSLFEESVVGATACSFASDLTSLSSQPRRIETIELSTRRIGRLARAERKEVLTSCKVCRLQIATFEELFLKEHGHLPRGSVERAQLAGVYARYREGKRAVRADASVRIQALFRGHAARSGCLERRRRDEERRRRREEERRRTREEEEEGDRPGRASADDVERIPDEIPRGGDEELSPAAIRDIARRSLRELRALKSTLAVTRHACREAPPPLAEDENETRMERERADGTRASPEIAGEIRRTRPDEGEDAPIAKPVERPAGEAGAVPADRRGRVARETIADRATPEERRAIAAEALGPRAIEGGRALPEDARAPGAVRAAREMPGLGSREGIVVDERVACEESFEAMSAKKEREEEEEEEEEERSLEREKLNSERLALCNYLKAHVEERMSRLEDTRSRPDEIELPRSRPDAPEREMTTRRTKEDPPYDARTADDDRNAEPDEHHPDVGDGDRSASVPSMLHLPAQARAGRTRAGGRRITERRDDRDDGTASTKETEPEDRGIEEGADVAPRACRGVADEGGPDASAGDSFATAFDHSQCFEVEVEDEFDGVFDRPSGCDGEGRADEPDGLLAVAGKPRGGAEKGDRDDDSSAEEGEGGREEEDEGGREEEDEPDRPLDDPTVVGLRREARKRGSRNDGEDEGENERSEEETDELDGFPDDPTIDNVQGRTTKKGGCADEVDEEGKDEFDGLLDDHAVADMQLRRAIEKGDLDNEEEIKGDDQEGKKENEERQRKTDEHDDLLDDCRLEQSRRKIHGVSPRPRPPEATEKEDGRGGRNRAEGEEESGATERRPVGEVGSVRDGRPAKVRAEDVGIRAPERRERRPAGGIRSPRGGLPAPGRARAAKGAERKREVQRAARREVEREVRRETRRGFQDEAKRSRGGYPSESDHDDFQRMYGEFEGDRSDIFELARDVLGGGEGIVPRHVVVIPTDEEDDGGAADGRRRPRVVRSSSTPSLSSLDDSRDYGDVGRRRGSDLPRDGEGVCRHRRRELASPAVHDARPSNGHRGGRCDKNVECRREYRERPNSDHFSSAASSSDLTPSDFEDDSDYGRGARHCSEDDSDYGRGARHCSDDDSDYGRGARHCSEDESDCRGHRGPSRRRSHSGDRHRHRHGHLQDRWDRHRSRSQDRHDRYASHPRHLSRSGDMHAVRERTHPQNSSRWREKKKYRYQRSRTRSAEERDRRGHSRNGHARERRKHRRSGRSREEESRHRLSQTRSRPKGGRRSKMRRGSRRSRHPHARPRQHGRRRSRTRSRSHRRRHSRARSRSHGGRRPRTRSASHRGSRPRTRRRSHRGRRRRHEEARRRDAQNSRRRRRSPGYSSEYSPDRSPSRRRRSGR